jgi:hypothetical protein
MVAAVLGYWALQWQAAPPAGAPSADRAAAAQRDGDDD